MVLRSVCVTFAAAMQVKQVIKYSLSILLAVYFLLAGTGFNIIDYCCPTCANKGIEQVAQVSCNGIHHDHHCSDKCKHDDGCQFIRCTPDNSIIAESDDLPDVNVLPLFGHLLSDTNTLLSAIHHTVYQYGGYYPYTSSSGGRVLLATYCTLLI